MEHLTPKRPMHKLFVLLLFPTVYVGYCIGTLYGQKIALETVQDLLVYALLHPFPVRITDWTKWAILCLLLVWLLAYAQYISSIRNYMPGKEYGTARIASPKEITNKLQDKDPSGNKILSENVRISLDGGKTGLNNNLLCVGGSGSGKSFFFVKENAYNCESSYVFCDPKGELLRDTGNYLQMHGYRIRVLNLVDMDASDCFNPFVYLRSDGDIIRLITSLIANTTPKGTSSSDPFWEKGEAMYLQAVFSYVWYEYPKQGKTPNFQGVLELLNKAKVSEEEDKLSELDELMYGLPEGHPALVAYKKVCSGAADTVRSILISANARLAYLQNPKVLRLLDHDDIDIPAIGEGIYRNPERKTALYCVIPDNDKSYNFIVGLLYTQLFQTLYYVADRTYGGRLPVPVALWMDEFPNVAQPEGFLEILATCRSRLISCNIIIQNMAQLHALYKDAAENIQGNCDTFLYLGGNEQSTHKHISEMLGKFTIDKKSSGETLGSHGSSSRNYDVLGRDILSPDEVRKLDNKKCIIFVKGFDPVIDYKYRTWEKPEYKEAIAFGPYMSRADQEEAYAEGERNYYLDACGPDADRKSVYYQTETFGGIYEESEVYKMLEVTDKTCCRFPWTSYRYDDVELTPAFALRAEYVQAGGERIRKHPVIGYFAGDRFVPVTPEEAEELFRKENRLKDRRKPYLEELEFEMI